MDTKKLYEYFKVFLASIINGLTFALFVTEDVSNIYKHWLLFSFLSFTLIMLAPYLYQYENIFEKFAFLKETFLLAMITTPIAAILSVVFIVLHLDTALWIVVSIQAIILAPRIILLILVAIGYWMQISITIAEFLIIATIAVYSIIIEIFQEKKT